MSRIAKLFVTIAFFLTQTPSGFTASSTPAETGLFKPDIFCQRQFLCKNRVSNIDSARKQDGEGLRPVLKKNPEAENLLNEYQTNQRSALKWPAFVGTFGALFAVGGHIYAGNLKESTAVERRNLQYAFVAGGGLIIYLAYKFSQHSIEKNEELLNRAIRTYNDGVPTEEKIMVNVEPVAGPEGSSVQGGSVKAGLKF